VVHEIDFKNFDKITLQNKAEVRDAAGFVFLRGSDDFIVQKVDIFIAINASLCWLNNVSCLFCHPL
jgi:hypothetical protein